MPRPFETEDGEKIPYLPNRASQFMDRSTVLYGPSKTGKSVAIKAIMKTLCPHIEQVILVSPTEAQNRGYAGIIPKAWIHSRIWLPPKEGTKGADREGGMRFFEKIWARQEMATSVYNRVNRIKILERLFRRIANKDDHRKVRKMNSYTETQQKRIRRHYTGGELETRMKGLNEQIKQLQLTFYKKTIIEKRKHLDRNWDSLSSDEQFTLARIDFNPRLLIILDDCAAELTSKIANSEVFKKIFFQGRHAMITIMIACHTPNDLPTGLRKNAMNSIFTSPDCATSYFTNSSNGFSVPTRKALVGKISSVFASEKSFLKFAYDRDEKARFFVFQVEYPRAFRFGSEELWRIGDAIAAEDGEMDRENEYYAAYASEGEAATASDGGAKSSRKKRAK